MDDYRLSVAGAGVAGVLLTPVSVRGAVFGLVLGPVLGVVEFGEVPGRFGLL